MKVSILEHDNFRAFTEKRYQVVQVSNGTVYHVYDTICDTLEACKAKIVVHGDELVKVGDFYQIIH